MPLQERIRNDMKTAMREKDKARLATIRLLMAAIKQREVDERIELDDGGVIGVIEKMVKQRRESVEQYRNAGRAELADQEQFEIGILADYLPPALDEAELDRLIGEAITATGAASMRDMGRVMSTLRSRVQGRADMADISRRVKARLSA